MRHGISAVLLAGGQGRRMGGSDKGWVYFRGQPLIEHTLGRLQRQADDIVISCNRNVERYASLSTIAVDQQPGFQGPLAGITAGARLCQQQWIQLCPCDTPNIPLDLSQQLLAIALSRHLTAITPEDESGQHYLCSLVHQSTLAKANKALARGDLAVHHWLSSVNGQCARIATEHHAFDNINTRGQLT